MNDDIKENLIKAVWDVWYSNEVSWYELFTYFATDFPKDIISRIEKQS